MEQGATKVRLTPAQIAQYARQAGFTGDALTTIVAIALAESSGETAARNPNGEESRGLTQINVAPNANPRYAGYDLYDPLVNMQVAYEMSAGGRNFRPWTTYSGSTRHGAARHYTNYMPQALAGVAGSGDVPGIDGLSPALSFNPQGSVAGAEPGADPGYLALLRALDFEEATQRWTTGSQIGQVRERLGFEAPRIQALGMEERRGIAGQHEARGIRRSGMALRADAQQRADEQYRLAQLTMTGGQDIAGLENQLAQYLADAQRRRAEAAATAGGRVYQGANSVG